MRFFTAEWWGGDGSSDVVAAYRRHFDAIRSQLAPDLVKLHECYSLHDGRVLSILIASPHLSLVVDTYDNSNVHRRLALQYARVKRFEIKSYGKRDISNPDSWGDLGYHEVDLIDDSTEHRIIFCNDVEMAIRFEAFAFSIEQGPD